MRSRISIDRKSVSFPLVIAFLFFAVSDISRMFQDIGLPREITYAVYYPLLFLFIFLNLKRIKNIDVFYYVVIIPYVLYGFLKNGSYIGTFTSYLAPILIFLPAFIFFRIMDKETLVKGFNDASIFSSIYLLIYYFLFLRNSDASYSMSYAYWITYPMVAIFNMLISKKKSNKLLWVVFIMLSYTMIAVGCRGALLLSILSIFYIYLTQILAEQNNSKKIVLLVLTTFVAVIIVFNYESFLILLEKYFGESRSIKKLINGSMFESKNRDFIYSQCKSLIDQNPFGYGPLASRRLLPGTVYPHSMYYEMQLDCGKYLGTFLFVVIIGISIVNLIRYRNSELKPLVVFVCIIGIGSLMVTSSYFYAFDVPASIALFLNSYRDRPFQTEGLS